MDTKTLDVPLARTRPSAPRRWFAKAAAVGALAVSATSSAFAGGVTVPVIDLGFEASDLTTIIQGYLVPFLVAAISVGFAFWAIFKGVRWIKGLVGG